MAFLGILKNVAKVGVGLLNGLLNGNSSALTFEERCRETPELVYVNADTKTRYRMLSKYVIVHPKVSALGAAPASEVSDGEVSIVLAEGDQGQQEVHAINHTKSPYIMAFNGTDSVGNVGIQNAIVMGTDSNQGNVTDITGPFLNYPGGNLIATRVENNDEQPTPGTLMLPPLSSVLANVGITTLISTISTVLYALRNGSMTLSWRTDGQNRIIGFTLTNTTTLSLNVTATLSWSNPRNARTYNSTLSGNATQNVDIEVAESPVNSASVAVYSSDMSPAQKQAVYDNIAQQAEFLGGAKRLNVHYPSHRNRQAGGGGYNPKPSTYPKLTPDERKRLARIVPALESTDMSDLSQQNQQLIDKIGSVPAAINLLSQIQAGRA